MRKQVLCKSVSMALLGWASGPVLASGGALEAAVALDRVEVRAQREAQIRAVDLKRSSDAIQDVVSADAMGDYPDKNVAESLQRLPGVSVTRDQGEGRFVVVRGLDAALNNVSIDGIAVGTPEDASRGAPLDVIPSDSTERLRVVKSVTPDMPGDAIGGSVIVESASAFDRDGRSLRGKLEASHQVLSGKTSPKAAFNYSQVFNDTFGVAVGINHQQREFESDNTEVEYDTFDGGLDSDLAAVEIQHRKYTIERERTGANINLDWRPDADTQYSLRTLYSRFNDAETRHRSIFGFGDGDIQALGDGRYQVNDLAADAIAKRLRFRTKEEDTMAASFAGEHRLDNAQVDYRLGWTKTRERVLDEIEARFDYVADDLSASIDQRSALPRYSVSENGWQDTANYEFDRMVVAPTLVDDKEHSAQVNLRFDGQSASYKVGLLGRWRERSADVNESELRRGPDVDLTSWQGEGLEHRHADLGQWLDSRRMNAWWAANKGNLSARPQDVAGNTALMLEDDYRAAEDIFATYAMGTWDVGDLRLIGGVRVENTQFSADGNRVDIDQDGVAQVSGRRVANSYTNVLPGLHARYDSHDGWVLRAAANKTVARPSFGDISPRLGMNRDEGEVRVGNPQLDPYESTNLDLSLERYLGDSGLVSLGLFNKSIDGYIVETVSDNNPDYPGYQVSTAINGDAATVRGAEFNWQQQLAGLPGVWSGLLIGASATWLDTDFDPGIAGRSGEDFMLPRASKQVYSGHVGYEYGPLSTRLAAVHRSHYLDSIGDSADYDVYVAPHTQLDFSLDFKLSSAVSLYLEASNLLDEPLELYQGNRSRTLQLEEYGRSYAIGVKVAL